MQVITYKDKNYCFDEITIDVYDRLYDWAKANVPDPIEVLKERVVGLPPELAKALADKAYEEIMATQDKSNPRIAQKIQSRDGIIKLLCLTLQSKHQDLTDEQAVEIIVGMMADKGMDWFNDFFWGLMPEAIRKDASLEAQFRAALEKGIASVNQQITTSGHHT